MTSATVGRDRLPRDVFRALFIHDTDRLETLDEATRSYLESIRSEETLADATPEWLRQVSEAPEPPPSSPRLRSTADRECAPRQSYVREITTAPARQRVKAS